MSSSEDREREPFRWCVFCDADCGAGNPEHSADCPSMTGIYVVRPDDCGPVCVHCRGRAYGGMHCVTCSTPLTIGARYMLRPVDPGNPLIEGIEGASVNEVICVGCAAQDAISEVAA